LLPCNAAFAKQDPGAFISYALNNGWQILSIDKKENLLDHSATSFENLDYITCRLPKLGPLEFTDPAKGIWEFFGLSEEAQRHFGIRGRDPAKDVKDGWIAIDFGTSSTVVAWDDNGNQELLRVGLQDFDAAPRAQDYENPTVLEFTDFKGLLSHWQTEVYRPGIRWGDEARCAHEAREILRTNESSSHVVASIVTKLKQWALRQDSDVLTRFTDRQGVEHEIAPMRARYPVKGGDLRVSADDPFDPVELYAWFLGMNINWRGRGLFLEYMLTFPADYPRPVKDNILDAFRRGLMRSLPEGLIDTEVFNQRFTVEERADEPAAYAAAALPLLDIPPTAEGIAYGIFDFGGGTADFNFGLYRLPDETEQDEGYEEVFEHFGTAGDKFLGGENLLENMAYLTFQENLEECRKKKITFTRPLGAQGFIGHEPVVDRTQAAQTNTQMLINRLRPLWEQGALPDASGMMKLPLLNRDGRQAQCEFAIPQGKLLEYLDERIAQGVESFYLAMKKAFADRMPDKVHVLLAGNASRAQQVLRLFGLENEAGEQAGEICHDQDGADDEQAPARKISQAVFGEACPRIKPYPPLLMDEENLFRPTAKTGVALGLLRLRRGGAVKLDNHVIRRQGDEAPFAYYVGRSKQGRFHVVLKQGAPYETWQELGKPRERVFELFHTRSPQANTGEMPIGASELRRETLRFAGAAEGPKVFARPTAPNRLEIATAASREAIERGEKDNLQTLDLKSFP
jgi:hypothetical protein